MSKHNMPKAPRSTIVPYIEGEDASDRHDRRRQAACRDEGELRRRCEAAGIGLKVSRDGQHWRFIRGRVVAVEWWPSSGRVVADRRYNRPAKAHDFEQVWTLVRASIPEAIQGPPLDEVEGREFQRVRDSSPLGYVPGKDMERLACERLARRGLIEARAEEGPGVAYYVRALTGQASNYESGE